MAHRTYLVYFVNGTKLTLVDTDTIEHDLAYYDSGILRISYTTFSRPSPDSKREIDKRKTTHHAPHSWSEVIEDWA